MMRIEWSAAASSDFESILFQIANENVSAAVRVDSQIERHVDLLADFPWMGRGGRVAGTRELVVPRCRCVVAYLVDGEIVRILRVIHGGQEWPASL
jgi:toxin ParE1/3/4